MTHKCYGLLLVSCIILPTNFHVMQNWNYTMLPWRPLLGLCSHKVNSNGELAMFRAYTLKKQKSLITQ